MANAFIQSASGWRKVFAQSNLEEDASATIGRENELLIAKCVDAFVAYLEEVAHIEQPSIVLGRDTRPTGAQIAKVAIKTLLARGVVIKYLGVVAAPEIMCFLNPRAFHEKKADAFIYVSASHNPIGHNGLKFGLATGGVLTAAENSKLLEIFSATAESSFTKAFEVGNDLVDQVIDTSSYLKSEALDCYKNFVQKRLSFSLPLESPQMKSPQMKSPQMKSPQGAPLAPPAPLCASQSSLVTQSPSSTISIVADLNGSARAKSIDKKLFAELAIPFYAINDEAGKIAHTIIPEGKSLEPLAYELERLQSLGVKSAVLGYMCDCDGDRGNTVYWSEKDGCAKVLESQEVFSLAVLSSLAQSFVAGDKNLSVAVNCATSRRIKEIAAIFGAKVHTCEVGEANVVACANEYLAAGENLRIAGEGSNGGVIVPPSAVRDPLDTVFLILKLLLDKNLFATWCDQCGVFFSDNYTLTDILQSLPQYTTTLVTDKRAVLHIATRDTAVLRRRFQNLFQNEWTAKKDSLFENFGILYWEAVVSSGTKCSRKVSDFGVSPTGGLKILFYGEGANPIASFWARKSGTEPVFRIMADVAGADEKAKRFHDYLLDWLTYMLRIADS